MSIAEVAPYPDEQQQSRSVDRTPPQDMVAEQCVLGSMMMSKDAIADVIEALRGPDFYRPAHEQVYDAIIDLYGRGEPADAVTVAAELGKRGELLRVGGAPYMHTLLASVPVAANAGYYAEIVREKAILRRLADASIRIGQMSYAGEGDVDDIVDRAQAEVYAVTDRRASEDYKPLSELMQPTLDEMEAISSRGGGISGVPTGFTELDELTNGLHPGQMIIVAARPGCGKALALDTPLPTPSGWTTMAAVQIGDLLLGADGRPTTVTATTEVMLDRDCYALTFSDGTTVVADADHEWMASDQVSRRRAQAEAYQTRQFVRQLVGGGAQGAAQSGYHRKPAQVTTRVMAGKVRNADHSLNWTVATTHALDLESVDVPADPYLVGAMFGDRAFASTVDLDRIPLTYLRGDQAGRRALLGGLLDQLGEIDAHGAIRCEVADPALQQDVHDLVSGLGYVAEVDGSALRFTALDDVFGERTAVGRSAATRHRLLRGIRHSGRRYVTDITPVGKVPVRCVEVDNESHLYLATRSMIPTHNSTLALDLARSASIKNGLTSAIFSLEMSQIEITMRLLSAEAQIPLGHIRGGNMSDDDWQRVAQKMGQVSEAPLFIDDSPNLTMMEIRAKARRLKQRHDLKLVCIDYIQLMTSGKKVESRQLEVSEFSRSIKLLAKELEVPVVALSQLNRGPEQRTDKKPMLSDLRESGCLTADTRILRADTGQEVAMGDLLADGVTNIPVWSLDDNRQLVARTMTHVFSSGVKDVFQLTLASGRQIKATSNHPFLTYGGWSALGDLEIGSRVAIPRRLPEPVEPTRWDDDEIVVLAHLLSDGSFVKRQPIRYASIDEANLTAVTEAAHRRFGITAIRDEYAAARVTTLRLPAPYRLARGKRNPIAQWLDGLGLFGLRSHEKFFPAEILGLPIDQAALFIRHLWATDGSVRWDEKAGMGRIYYASTSLRMIDDLARLLLRFGIVARIKVARKAGYRDGYHLQISGATDQMRFCTAIGVHGLRGERVREVMTQLPSIKVNTNLDTIPSDVWDRVRDQLVVRGMTHREFAAAMDIQFCGSTLWKHAPSRQRLGRAAEILKDPELLSDSTNDVYWDAVVSVESLGEQEVFDATVIGTHNFIADGIAVHNSLEQDADMVILLNRPDLYDKESERAGEADMDVAKHRNGPTKTITLAFQGHYSRFSDMQH